MPSAEHVGAFEDAVDCVEKRGICGCSFVMHSEGPSDKQCHDRDAVCRIHVAEELVVKIINQHVDGMTELTSVLVRMKDTGSILYCWQAVHDVRQVA